MGIVVYFFDNNTHQIYYILTFLSQESLGSEPDGGKVKVKGGSNVIARNMRT